MLEISKISLTDAYQDGWKKQRLGKFTASLMHKLISTKSHEGIFTTGAITYIESVAGEILTGRPMKAEFFNSDVDYGNAMEPEAISYFEEKTGRIVFRDTERADTHRLIIEDQYSACTPDALVVMADSVRTVFDSTGTKLKIAPLETKCPPVGHRFIKLYKCKTPEDLKKTQEDYYWQVMTQMHFCNSLTGFFGAYNPEFPDKMRLIEFNKAGLVDDLVKLKNTLIHAKKELKNCLSLFDTE